GQRAREIIDDGNISTHYRIGILIDEKGAQTLPAENKDLTVIERFELDDVPYKGFSVVPERSNEDSLVYQMICFESLSRVSSEIGNVPDVVSEESEHNYLELLDDLGARLCLGAHIAKEQLQEAVEFG